MTEVKDTDWIEKQHHAQELLGLARERKWSYLCEAIQHCVDSYNRLYGASVGAVATCSEEGDVTWQSTKTTQRRTVVLEFKPDTGVEAVYNKHIKGAKTDKKLLILVLFEDAPVWRLGEKIFSNEDEASQAILKQVLFPDAPT